MQAGPYADADAPELVRMWRASFEHGVGITDPHPIDEQLQYFLREVVPTHVVRVVRDDGAIVAFLASTPETIAHLYVKVSHHGRGIGSMLVRLAQAESCGSLWLYTFERNHVARRFYQRHGFSEVERESQNMFRLEAIKYLWQRA